MNRPNWKNALRPEQIKALRARSAADDITPLQLAVISGISAGMDEDAIRESVTHGRRGSALGQFNRAVELLMLRGYLHYDRRATRSGYGFGPEV